MIAIAMLISAIVTLVRAEVHSVTLINDCKSGTIQFQPFASSAGGPVQTTVKSNSVVWTNNDGPLAGIAYLDLFDDQSSCTTGSDCPIVIVALDNSQPQSSAWINIPIGLYYGPIDARFVGGSIGNCVNISPVICENEDCQLPILCDDKNVNVVITFCVP